MIDSVIDQTYSNWQLCIADGSDDEKTISILKEYSKKYPNVIIAIEDGEGKINEEEVKVMSELFAIELEISFYENVLAFKLGRRNANELF